MVLRLSLLRTMAARAAPKPRHAAPRAGKTAAAQETSPIVQPPPNTTGSSDKLFWRIRCPWLFPGWRWLLLQYGLRHGLHVWRHHGIFSDKSDVRTKTSHSHSQRQ